MTSILFKGKENLSEVQDLLNRNGTDNSFRVRESFTQNGRKYPSVDLIEYQDAEGVRRVLSPGRVIDIDNGVVVQKPQK